MNDGQPVKINLGCGSIPENGYINVDAVAQPGVDVVHDLDVFPWPFATGAAGEVRAFDVYEHIADPLGFMAECHRILEPGGLLYIHTSFWKNENSFRDPTHRRFLTEGSFDYWIPGTDMNVRYGAAYTRGCLFGRDRIWLDTPDGDLNVSLRRI